MLKPFGALSLSIGSLSAAVATGGGATGGSFFAASVAGRPIKGEPGGGGAACWGGGAVCCSAATGEAVGCCATAANVAASNVPRVPASKHGREKWVMMILPELIIRLALSFDLHRGPRIDELPFDRSRLQFRSSACGPWPRHSV